MWLSSLLFRPVDQPIWALVAVFIGWKSLLLLVAACTPGPGYDTSTHLVLSLENISNTHLEAVLRAISAKLTKWDAVYFTTTAHRGYVFEQEWAFSWGFTRIIKFFANDLRDLGLRDYGEFLESFVAITISHASHFLSVLVLYALARAIFPGPSTKKFAFVTACLHILSPAGLFLSSPYGESTFALLNFLGCLLFVQSFGLAEESTFLHDISLVASGLSSAAATTVRTNGILNGIMFLEEALRILYSMRAGLTLPAVRRLVASGIGGLCIAMGFVLPQYLAYEEFCVNRWSPNIQPPRVWCEKMLPSIYAFVQDYYWHVGFLRYWTLSNIPLFLLATPMLTFMALSCLWAVDSRSPLTAQASKEDIDSALAGLAPRLTARTNRLLRSLALPQFVLAFMALTSYHVQIITRLSSGYAIWYLWLAASLGVNPNLAKSISGLRNLGRLGGAAVRYLMIYALIQGGLFSSFLPPA